MDSEKLVRVVVSHRGKVRQVEFRLRKGEIGLSSFLSPNLATDEAILQAVRAAGKQGELVIAAIPMEVIRELGLRVIPTPGGTPDPEVNRLHVELRPSRLVRALLWIKGRAVPDWFNESVSPALAAAAHVIER